MRLTNAKAETVLATDCSATDTAILVQAPLLGSLPTVFPCRIWIDREMMWATAGVGESFVVVRGKENSIQEAHLAGSCVIFPLLGVDVPLTSAVAYELLVRTCSKGNNIYETLVGAEPTSAKEGDLDFYLNGYEIVRFRRSVSDTDPSDDAGGIDNWIPWGPIFPFIRPHDPDFSWVNQGSATVDITHGGIHLSAPLSATTELRCRTMTLSPAADNFTLSAGFLMLTFAVDSQACGLFLRDSGSGKLITFQFNVSFGVGGGAPATSGSSAGLSIEVRTYDGVSTLNTVLFSQQILYPMLFMTIHQATSGLATFSVSTNGQHFEDVFSMTATDFLTADEVGFFANDESNTYDAQMTLLHWNLVEAVDPIVDVMYTISSPRQSQFGTMTRYLYILPPTRDKLYRSIGPYSGGVPGDWDAWVEEAIPVGFAPRRVIGCPATGMALCFGDAGVLSFLTKATSTDSVEYATDQPWVEYPLTVSAKPDGGDPAIENDPSFWDPSLSGSIPQGYIGTDEFMHSNRTASPAPGGLITFDTLDEGVNELPTGRVWHKIISRQDTSWDDFFGTIAVGVGDKIARRLSSAGVWSLKTCPDGDLRDVSMSNSNTIVAVGIGVPIVYSYDYGVTWASFPAVAGWTPVAPRIIFDPNLYINEGGTSLKGTFVVVGGTVAGAAAVMLLGLRNSDDQLETAVLAGLPTLTSTTILQAAAIANQTDGCIIVGVDSAIAADDPEAVIIIVNPEQFLSGSAATYNDWHLRTLAQTPFGGLS